MGKTKWTLESKDGKLIADIERAIKADKRLDVGIAKKNGHEFGGYTETVTFTQENREIIESIIESFAAPIAA